MAWDPYNVQKWKHKVGFHNGGILRDTPMARWLARGTTFCNKQCKHDPRRGMSLGTCSSRRNSRWTRERIQRVRTENLTVGSAPIQEENEDLHSKEGKTPSARLARSWDAFAAAHNRITGLKNLRSVTWYLNQVSICTWDRFPVIRREDGEGLVRPHDKLVKAAC